MRDKRQKDRLSHKKKEKSGGGTDETEGRKGALKRRQAAGSRTDRDR